MVLVSIVLSSDDGTEHGVSLDFGSMVALNEDVEEDLGIGQASSCGWGAGRPVDIGAAVNNLRRSSGGSLRRHGGI